MANRSVSAGYSAWHGQLTAGEEEVVQFAVDLTRVEIVVESGTSAPVFYTTDGRTASVPSLHSSSVCGVVLPGSAVVDEAPGDVQAQVRLRSAEPARFHVIDGSSR